MIIINTPTIEDYIEVVNWAIDTGKSWSNNDKSIHKEFWVKYRSNMCVVIRDDKLSYCSMYYIKNYRWDILNMEQFYVKIKRYRTNYIGKRYDLR